MHCLKLRAAFSKAIHIICFGKGMAANHAVHRSKRLCCGIEVTGECVLALTAYGTGNGTKLFGHSFISFSYRFLQEFSDKTCRFKVFGTKLNFSK